MVLAMKRNTIESAMMKLPAKARGKLAATLLSTLDMDDPEEMERIWAEEADRRFRAFRSARTSTTPAARAIAAARAALRS